MCSEYMCGGYGGGYEPPHDEPFWYKILDGFVWVIWALYQPVKLVKRVTGKRK